MNEHSRQVVHSSKFQDWETETDIVAWLDCAFGLTIDVCATKASAKCARYYTPEDDGLRCPWDNEVAFYNPRYSMTRWWVEKARDQAERFGTLSVGLVAARVGSNSARDADAGFWDVVQREAGPLRRSYYHPESRVTWLCWRHLITGTYFHDERLHFRRDGKPVKSGAPFDSAIVIFAPPLGAKRPPAPRWGSRRLAQFKREMDALGNNFSKRPLLSAGQPW